MKRRATSIDGNGLGKAHSNPILDTREQNIELDDGTTDWIFVDKIAENI